MEMNTQEIIKKMTLDAQEMTRDYKVYSDKLEDNELSKMFKRFAEECGHQAKQLQDTIKEKL